MSERAKLQYKGLQLSDSSLVVRDQFVTYQGTGLLTGVRQHFVRLAGCTVRCPLRKNCDQPEALNRGEGKNVSVSEIVSRALSVGWLHITGGEPAEHAGLVSLCDAANAIGLKVQVQTSGTIPIQWNHIPFVSVSPKQPTIKIDPSEIILIAARWMTPQFAISAISKSTCPVFVVPEAVQGKFGTDRMFELIDNLQSQGVDARAGLQSHLIWSVK